MAMMMMMVTTLPYWLLLHWTTTVCVCTATAAPAGMLAFSFWGFFYDGWCWLPFFKISGLVLISFIPPTLTITTTVPPRTQLSYTSGLCNGCTNFVNFAAILCNINVLLDGCFLYVCVCVLVCVYITANVVCYFVAFYLFPQNPLTSIHYFIILMAVLLHMLAVLHFILLFFFFFFFSSLFYFFFSCIFPW